MASKKKPKVCIISMQYPPIEGGISVATSRIATILKKDADVHVLTRGIEKDGFLVNRARHLTTGIEDGVTVHRVSPFSGQVSFVPPQEIQNFCHFLEVLDKKYGFDIFHGINLTGAGEIAAFTGKKLGKKIIASIRGNDIGRDVFDATRTFSIKWMLDNADIVTSNAQDLLELANILTDARKKSVYIPNSLNPFDFHYREVKLRLDGFVVGFVGLARRKKGISYLLEGFKRFREEHEATLLFIGEFAAEEKATYMNMIESLKLENDVMITGNIPHRHILNYINLIDAFVLPTLSDGFPNALLEAMYSRKPCISTPVGGCRDIIKDGENGILIPLHSSEGIYSALVRLKKSPPLRKKLGENARKSVLDMSDPEKEKKSWLELYRKCIAGIGKQKPGV